MFCPYCKSSKSKVVDKRNSDGDKVIRRRRECLKCKERFTTYEKAMLDLMVQKRNGKAERFDPQKLRCGIMKACEKRPVGVKTIDKIVSGIESDLRALHKPEIRSVLIGDMVMERLKKLDKVAFVRFASYYRQFKDIQTFKKALG